MSEVPKKLQNANCPIDVYVDAFIPFNRLENPLPVTVPPDTTYYHEFAGDGKNRGFVKAGPSRMYASVVVDICAKNPLITKSHDTGITRGYRYETIKVKDVPWYDIFTPAYRVIEVSDTAKASTSGLEEKIKKTSECCVEITIDGAAGNPLITAAPDIDYHYVVTLCCEKDDEITYQIKGYHDGFPAYSIFIGPKLVYSHDPRTTGQTPHSLWGSGEFSVSVSGKISTKCKCCPTKKISYSDLSIPKDEVKSARAAWKIIAKKTGLKPSDVKSAHTRTHYKWVLKKKKRE